MLKLALYWAIISLVFEHFHEDLFELYNKERQFEQLARNKASNPMEDSNSTLSYYQKTDYSHGSILSWTFNIFISRSNHNIHLKPANDYAEITQLCSFLANVMILDRYIDRILGLYQKSKHSVKLIIDAFEISFQIRIFGRVIVFGFEIVHQVINHFYTCSNEIIWYATKLKKSWFLSLLSRGVISMPCKTSCLGLPSTGKNSFNLKSYCLHIWILTELQA